MANNSVVTVALLNSFAQGFSEKADTRYVKKEAGKGLSSNDFTDALENKLDGIASATTSAEGLVQLSSATNSTDEDKAATPAAVKAAYDLANGKQSPATTLDGYGITDAYTKTEVDNAIAAQIDSVYKPAGSKTAAELTSALLVAANLGNVYNITDALTTTADFVDGADKTYGVGADVSVVDVGTSESPVYKFNVLPGFVDLSGYATTEALAEATSAASSQDIQDILDGLWTEEDPEENP